MTSSTARFATIGLALAGLSFAGPAGYGVCQAGCSAVVMACYSAAGCTWGATLRASAPHTLEGLHTWAELHSSEDMHSLRGLQ
ncbi:hypothetical protein PSPO01_16117 [Paraphaeosphaeria sporulosa]